VAAISNMTRFVAVNFNDCPEPLIEDYLLQSAIDFCRRTYAWVGTETETLASTDFPFEVSAPSGGQVLKVLSIVTDSTALESAAVRDLDLTVTDWRTTTGTPEMFVEEARGTVTVTPLPQASADYAITTAYEPTITSKTIPDSLYNDHRDAIVSGAIMRLSMTALWLNANLATAHRAFYEDGVLRALVQFHSHHVLRGMNIAASSIYSI